MQPAWPHLNFSANDQFATAMHAVQRLWQYGYRRIALVLDPEVDAMVERRFSAGFWAALEGFAGCERIPTFQFQQGREVTFRAWHAQHRPDAIVCVHEEVRKWVADMHLKIPEDIALAHLDRHEDLSDWAGMNQNNVLVGAAAVDMLVGQLHRNEVGLPGVPQKPASSKAHGWMARLPSGTPCASKLAGKGTPMPHRNRLAAA